MKRPAAALAAILVSFAVLYIFFLAREFLFVRQQGILPNLLTRWHMARAFVFALDWAPLVQAAAILVAFGIFKDGSRVRNVSPSLLQSARGMLVAILALSAAFAFLLVFGAPAARKEIGHIRMASSAFETRIKAVEAALEAKRWGEAQEALEASAAIDRDDKRYIEMKGRYDRRPGVEPAESPAPATGISALAKAELTANEYFLKARQARIRGDLYTAHSLATKAYRIDPKRLDAQRLAAEIWNEISTMKDAAPEIEQRRIALQKIEAYKTLQGGDPIGAYAQFLELRKKAPKDEDIEEYLNESLEEAKGISFFKEEISGLNYLRSVPELFFRSSGPGGRQCFLACGTAYFGVERAYMSRLEYLELGPSGEVLTRLSTPYAKLQGSRLLLACYDADDPRQAFLPTFAVREKGAMAVNFVEVPFALPELKLAAVAAAEPAEASILEIEAIRRGASSIGVDPAPFVREGLMRIQACVAFLIVSLMSLYMGNRFRHKGDKPPYLSAVLVFPASVLVAGIFLQSWSWLSETVMTIFLRDVPQVSIVAFIVAQAAALALAFVILAGYRDAPSD